jgi:hypothetical protein
VIPPQGLSSQQTEISGTVNHYCLPAAASVNSYGVQLVQSSPAWTSTIRNVLSGGMLLARSETETERLDRNWSNLLQGLRSSRRPAGVAVIVVRLAGRHTIDSDKPST